MEGVPEERVVATPLALHGRNAADSAPVAPPLHVFVPMKAPSINRTFSILFHKRTVEKRTDVLLFEAKFKSFLPAWTPQPHTQYVLLLIFYEEWLSKSAKTIKRKDVHNLVKVIQDALCSRYGLDDAWVWITMACKASPKPQEGIEVYMTEMTEGLLEELTALLSRMPQ